MTDIVLPCLDEAAALPWVLARIPDGYRAIVADNGSTDGSPRIAAEHGAVVVHVPERGFGAAVHAGLLVAEQLATGRLGPDRLGPHSLGPGRIGPGGIRPGGLGPSRIGPGGLIADSGRDDGVVCVMDADGSFDPAQLPLVADPVRAGAVDLMLGRRRPTRRGAWPAHARLGNTLVAWRLRRKARILVHDLGPMRAAHRRALLALGLRDRRFGYPLEMVVRAAGAGWRIAEVDVDYAPRAEGTRSKVTGTVRGTVRTVRDMAKVLA